MIMAKNKGKFVKIPVDDMYLITAIIDVMEAITPPQHKENVTKCYHWLHSGKYDIVDEESDGKEAGDGNQ